MNIEEQAKIIQTNIAHEQRNAGGSYWEVHAQSNMKFAMATWPAKRLDETAIENPRFFKARYGFEACTLARIKVIAFQRKFDLLDSEITSLKKSGFLKVDRQSLRIDKSYLVPLLGWLQIGMLGMVIAMLIAMIGFSKAPEWKQGVGFALLGLILAPTLVWIARSCILPRRLLKDCGALDDEAGSAAGPGRSPAV